ncbi:MAG: hypothetical protein ACOC2Y_03065 [Spirochaetota bacterium]
MSDNREIVPTKTLVRQGTTGIGGVVGGGALLLLGALGGPWAFIIGGIVTLAGAGIATASKEDRLAGGVLAGAGALTILSGLGLGIGGGLLTLGGIGLIAVGGVSLYRFIKGLRSRR